MSNQESITAEDQETDNNESLNRATSSVTMTILDGKFFTINNEKSSITSNSITAQCQLCLPNTEEIKSSASSSSNLFISFKETTL